MFELGTWNFQHDLHKIQTPFLVAVVVCLRSNHEMALPKTFYFLITTVTVVIVDWVIGSPELSVKHKKNKYIVKKEKEIQ